jgi:hypothetical protein
MSNPVNTQPIKLRWLGLNNNQCLNVFPGGVNLSDCGDVTNQNTTWMLDGNQIRWHGDKSATCLNVSGGSQSGPLIRYTCNPKDQNNQFQLANGQIKWTGDNNNQCVFVWNGVNTNAANGAKLTPLYSCSSNNGNDPNGLWKWIPAVDCTDPKNLWDNYCDQYGYTAQVQGGRDTYCNQDANATSGNCASWCGKMDSNCTLKQNCDMSQLTGSNCTNANVTDLQKQCAAMGITTVVGGGNNEPCTQASINDLKQACQQYGVPVSSCGLTTYNNAKSAALAVEGATANAAQLAASTKSNTDTLNAITSQILQAVNQPTPTTSVTTEMPSQEVLIVAAAVIVLCVCCSSMLLMRR